MAPDCDAPYPERMATYRFELQANSNPSADSSAAPQVFECENNRAAIAKAEILAKKLKPGHVAKLIGADGAILWMGAPEERR